MQEQRSDFIPLSVPNLDGNERKYLLETLDSLWVSTGGPYIDRFEESMAAYLGVTRTVACQSGTAGLHLALQILGVKAGEAVFVPSLTFIAAVNPVRYVGAEPIFIDADHRLCMDPVKLQAFIDSECQMDQQGLMHRASGRRIRCLLLVHVFGNMADMPALMAIAKRYDLKVLEDATEALGTQYKQGPYEGQYAGCLGDVGVYSFNANKIITTGGGGMLTSPHNKLLEQAKHLSTQAKVSQDDYLHDQVGYNYRMTNMQAAVGLAQLERLDEIIAYKAKSYAHYAEGIAQMKGLTLLHFADDIAPNYWFYALLIDDDFPYNRQRLQKYFAEHQVQTRPIWGLIHEQTPYLGAIQGDLSQAHYYRDRVLNLPCSSNLPRADLDAVLDLLRACQASARRRS